MKAPLRLPAFLDRYRTIVDDWELFSRAILRPLPLSIWANPQKISRPDLSALLRGGGLIVSEHGWNDLGLNVDGFSNPGHGLAYQLGLYHIQEEVSLLPVLLAPPQKGERILDLCAAPGNKTVLSSALLEDTGEVVANDRSAGRLQVLKRQLSRLGLCNVSITVQNGGRFDVARNEFDRVLVDVPCSCEGTIRKNKNLFYSHHSYSTSLVSTQRFILKRAGELCRPGSLLIYSTCTFAPEENEANVDWFLRKNSGRFKVCKINRPKDFHLSQGLSSWQGQDFCESLRDTIRIWPHHNDSGGFYIAIMECVAGEKQAD